MIILGRIKKMAPGASGRRFAVFSASLAVSLCLVSCKPSAPAPSGEPSFSPTAAAAVHSVIDGDTIVIENSEKIRFLGLNAPEIRKGQEGSYHGSEQPWGRDAANYVYRLLSGNKVELEYDPAITTDHYGRTLAYVILSGEMVNARLLEQGYARFNDYGNELKYEDYLRGKEEIARAKKRGLWGEAKGGFKPPVYYLTSKWSEYYFDPGSAEAGKIGPEDRVRVTEEEGRKLGLKPY